LAARHKFLMFMIVFVLEIVIIVGLFTQER